MTTEERAWVRNPNARIDEMQEAGLMECSVKHLRGAKAMALGWEAHPSHWFRCRPSRALLGHAMASTHYVRDGVGWTSAAGEALCGEHLLEHMDLGVDEVRVP